MQSFVITIELWRSVGYCGDQLARHTPANITYRDNSHAKPTGVVKFSNRNRAAGKERLHPLLL